MTSPIDINHQPEAHWFLKQTAALKYSSPFPQVNQSTGHHDTDKLIALKVSPSPDPLAKCSNRSRGIFEV